MSDDTSFRPGRRAFTQSSAAALLAALAPNVNAKGTVSGGPITTLSLGMLIFPRMDQIDFTGPFSVLSRLPAATVHVFSRDGLPVQDHKGLALTPTVSCAAAPPFDLLVVPGGPGQESLMHEESLLSLIRAHANSGKMIFSVCTGALICGAAGILRGRKATTHWSAFPLLRYFGAIAADARVVVDGNLVTAAGVTAGIDGALTIAALLRGPQVAQQIQLDIQYAPQPPFNSGTPKTAPPDVFAAVSARYKPLTDARQLTAKQVARQLGIPGP